MLSSMDRHADIHFKKFCIPVSTGASKVDKILKMPPDSISEGVIFKISWGVCPQIPIVLACFACLCASHTMSVSMYLTSHTLTMMTGLVVPPFQKFRSAPVILGTQACILFRAIEELCSVCLWLGST